MLLWQSVTMANAKELLEHVRKSLGARSIRNLAPILDLPISDIQNAYNGKSQQALDRVVSKARERLRMPPGWPAEGVVPVVAGPMVKIPLVGVAEAGDGADDDLDMEQEIPSTLFHGAEFGFVVRGDSLMPHVMPGDILIARPEKRAFYNYPMIVRRESGDVSAKIVVWDSSSNEPKLRSTDGRPDEPATVEYLGLVTGIYRYRGGTQKAVGNIHGLKLEEI